MSDSTPARIYRFGRFQLDMAERQLRQDGSPVDVNGRYLDALALLAQEGGKLVSKDRFMDEVWRGIPVTDEALTQCIRSLRKQLGDDAARPQFIETVPKYGYRFIAAVNGPDMPNPSEERPSLRPEPARYGWRPVLLLGSAGTVGGGMAGLIGGLVYGLIGMTQPAQPGIGATSALLVIVSIATLLGIAGGAGVGFGAAAAGSAQAERAYRTVLGGAIGGLVVGALAKLIGMDAFTLLIGLSPTNITGPMEGAILGAATGLAIDLLARRKPLRLSSGKVAVVAAIGAATGTAIALAGGRLMLGSLDGLAQIFPQSRLSMGQLGSLFGEQGFGLVSRIASAAFEAMLFTTGVAIATAIAQRDLPDTATDMKSRKEN